MVHSDSELRSVVEHHRRSGTPIPTIGLLGGDLCRTVGGPGDPARLSDGGVVLPVDLVRVDIDGHTHWFCSHLIARRRLWLGRAVVAMNAQWLGDLRLGPRAHPGDGLVDVTDGALPFGDLAEARRRARTGTHVPHPALAVRRTRHHDITVQRPVMIWLDGELVTNAARHLTIDVEPDSLSIVV